MNRRNFLTTAIALSLTKPDGIEEILSQQDKESNLIHSSLDWEKIGKEIYFAKIDIYKNNEKVDTIACIKINPEYNKIRVFNTYNSPENYKLFTIKEWQQLTNATVMINSAQYMAQPYAMPCALIICDGKVKGPKQNKMVKGMLVAEPRDKSRPLADILDFEYDKFDYDKIVNTYAQGVQHWPILLDRNKKIKVNKTEWKANRSVIAKDFDNNLLFFTTERGYFTLYNLGRFLKNNSFNIHTAMNLDGGYEACMSIKTKDLSYITYGQYETRGPDINLTIPGARIAIPGAIGIFSR